MTISTAMAALAGVLLLAGCSSSPFGSNTSDFDRTFIGAAQTWDLDKNSSVTCDEWKQYTATLLKENDANGDGALDQQEFRSVVRSDRLFEVANVSYFDLNSDGRVSLEEFSGKPNRAFALLDKNGDCQIDRTETVLVVGTEKKKDTSTGGGDTAGGGVPGRSGY